MNKGTPQHKTVSPFAFGFAEMARSFSIVIYISEFLAGKILGDFFLWHRVLRCPLRVRF